jgi:serine/threonine-protein kinase RsbW
MKFPGGLADRHRALDVVASALGRIDGAGRTFRDEVLSAFAEAFNNITIHSYARGTAGLVETEIEVADEAITIRLSDWGRSFDPATVAVPDLDALPESGMGLFIIRSFMDQVSYQPGAPNVLSMRKRYPCRRGEQQGDETHEGNGE